MAQQFSITDQKRITLLSLVSSAATLGGDDLEGVYGEAKGVLALLEKDGFFEGNGSTPSSQPSRTSGRQGSSSRNGNRGRDRQGGGGGMKDPQGPPTDKQVAFLLKQTNDYTEDEVYDMTKQEVSNLIDDLVG
jgi:hypothetical protein